MSDTTTAESPAFETWGILELMGHVRLAGMVSEVELFGGPMCRIDVPLAEGKWLTRYFGPASIYSLTPTDEAAARAVAASCRPQPVHAYELPTVPARVDYDPPGEEDDDDSF